MKILMKLMVVLFAGLILGGTAHADFNSGGGFTCVRNGNYVDLLNLRTRKVIWQFVFSIECDKAREEARSGYMCVPNGNNASLIFRNGEIINNFSFSSECEAARRDILSHL